jgi:hypothetical protein
MPPPTHTTSTSTSSSTGPPAGSFYRCGRCNWRPEPGDSLTEHAEAAGHPLCVACTRSLPPDRPRVCRDCQDGTAVRLDEVLLMWRELPDLLEQHADEDMPGGDVLTLLAPGGRGAQGGLLGDRQAQLEADDNSMEQTPSVAWTLLSWEDDWRQTRGEPASPLPPTAATSVVLAAHAYLVEHAAWAAEQHWSWQEYAADITHLHKALRVATDRHRAPRRLNLDCFACRGKLVVRVHPDHDQQPATDDPQWWILDGVAGPVDATTYKARVDLPRAGLEADEAVCKDCGQKYDAAALLLAKRQKLEDAQWDRDDAGLWGTVRAVADHVDRSHWTLRTWWRQQLVRGRYQDGDLYLHLADVQAESDLRAPRRARAKDQR